MSLIVSLHFYEDGGSSGNCPKVRKLLGLYRPICEFLEWNLSPPR